VTDPPPLPLSGVTTIDLTHAYAGPLCTYQLALLGADVIKVEPPRGGDDFRWRESAFVALNSGKRSITLDLKTSGGQEVLGRLLDGADVLVENFRPGVPARLGLEPAALRRTHPRLVYCSITGFGETGPLRDTPAIEWAVQAASGLTAEYLADEDDPLRSGLPVIDAFSGFTAVSAILAALLLRERTGDGTRLDIAMFDAAFGLLSARVAEAANSVPRRGLTRPGSGRYRARDRVLYVSSVHDKWFQGLCDVLGAPELAEDPRFSEASVRTEHSRELHRELEARLVTRDAEEWQRELNARGIPAAVVCTLAEAVRDPHVEHRRLLRAVDSARGAVTVMGAPFTVSEVEHAPASTHVPTLGEHTQEILSALGYDDAAVAELRSTGSV
jgi:crotonobetainyl-CoA:carnitine CoA-transferase CaiB-like acyl-CoA transferase